ncbi:MAG: hypothetical protein ABIH69_05015 [bacterium]
MSAIKAKKHFLGLDKHERLNCAAAVFKAFDQEGSCHCQGGGHSPDGKCGAYCAAKCILEKKHPEKLQDFEKFFLDLAGSLGCREIKKLKKLSCLGCVEKSAEYLQTHYQEL